jgi:hypothetical protein
VRLGKPPHIWTARPATWPPRPSGAGQGPGRSRSPGMTRWKRPRPASGQRKMAGAWKGSSRPTARTGSTGRSGLRRRFLSPRGTS